MKGSSSAERIAHKIVATGDYCASNDALHDRDELQRRLHSSGYLFFRALLNRSALLGVRRDILELCRDHGWLDQNAPLLNGIYSGVPFPDQQEYMLLYRKLLQLHSFNAFSTSSEIVSLFAYILDGEILTHSRNIARISFPRNYACTTQPHQDFFYIRGTSETFTAWIPAGDCPRQLGGLALMEGSHRLGFLHHEPAMGAGGNAIRTTNLTSPWLTTDFELGDFVLFHSHTIHGALDNETFDRVRLSLDYRYQRADQEVDPSSLLPHGG